MASGGGAELRQKQFVLIGICIALAGVPTLSYGQNASFQGLGILPGYDSSHATRISHDGLVVAGYARNAAFQTQAFRWTATTGIVGLGVLPGFTSSQASGVNSDGSVIVGTSDTQAFRWTPAGMVALGFSSAGDVSSDGKVIVGTNAGQAIRWTAAGITPLGYLPDATSSAATATNADGSIVAGNSGGGDNGSTAFRWTSLSGMIGLGGNPCGALRETHRGIGSSVNADGAVVVGYDGCVTFSVLPPFGAFRWTPSTGLVKLGHLPHSNARIASTAHGVSADGTVVVGTSGPDQPALSGPGGMLVETLGRR